ncbi:MAG TPA: MIP family channel protein [Candidatus Binatus sp.]|nr:MIP family channel protein [Candidatus Binatus sp.]
MSIAKEAMAEAWGTFLLTLIGPGAITALSYLDSTGRSGLLPDSARLGFIGLAHGVALIAAAYSVGYISGAHINPAVTIAHWRSKRINRAKVVPYILAQFLGASIAGFTQLAIWWSASPAAYNVAKNTLLGDTTIGADFGVGPALLVEVIGTAILVFTIFGANDHEAGSSSKAFAGVAIGLVLAGIVWIFGPISGASLNPARTFGPTLASAVFSLTPFSNYWIYVVGPLLGGLLGGFLYDAIRSDKTANAKRAVH